MDERAEGIAAEIAQQQANLESNRALKRMVARLRLPILRRDLADIINTDIARELEQQRRDSVPPAP